MTTRLNIEVARGDLDAAIASACHEPVVLEEAGAARAVILSPSDFEQYLAFVRQRTGEAIDAIRAANADADPDEVLREVTAVVEEVRAEMYDRTRRS
jgi:hypothetical protein